MGTKGYDCIEIPGAAKGTMCEDFTANAGTRLNANYFCGDSGGLVTQKEGQRGANSGTICSELYWIFMHLKWFFSLSFIFFKI